MGISILVKMFKVSTLLVLLSPMSNSLASCCIEISTS